MLTDKRLYDAESLTRSRSTDNPSATKGIDNVNPSFAKLRFVVIALAHRYIHTILILYQFLALLE